ncbi:helix-turn-helix transcriptional regulator [Halorientalis salina]|uniref:helix-turn-helix transcriptional regulator n=1 Tax=Halorientalis salina TaxID=2932266 RepID=UPI0010AD8969|nr:hypothetical protein [Halorientalis salina]
MARAGTVALLALVLLGTASLVAVGGATAETPTHRSGALPDDITGTQTAVDPDRVLLRADVRADGTADWTIEYRVLLDDRNTTDAFESVAADIRNDSAPFTARFTDRMGGTVGTAANATGREMALRNVSVETERQNLGQSYGIVRYRFTWEGFATANETHVEAGDALAGFYLDGESQLRIDWPEEYRAVSVSPNASERLDRGVVWEGRRDFGSEGPRVVATSESATDTGSTIAGTTLAGVAVVALVLGVGGYLLARRKGLVGQSGTDGTETAAGDAGAAAGASDDVADRDEGDDGPPEELLSNEEQVLRLLESEGGRVKQQQVAAQLDWTDAKTSQVVSKLREEEEIEVFRIGRENVLSHPDDDSI